MPAFGDWLRQQREAKGHGQAEFARLVGLSKQFVSDIEMGRVRNNNQVVLPSDETLTKIAKHFEVDFDVLQKLALRDRLGNQELEAAAEIALEEKTEDEFAGMWVKVHSRKAEVPEDQQEAYAKELADMARLLYEKYRKK